MPAFSVIIPHLNQPDALERCLASLVAGRRAPDEVIVVDNGSETLPTQICAQFSARISNLQLLQDLTPGPGPARNCGVAAAKGDVFAFIDADCLADPDWLSAAQEALSDPEADILGGDVRIARVDPDKLTVLEAYESIYAYRMDRYIAREGFTGTGNLVVRRAVLGAVGPFAGIGVAEDRDWGQRATGMGHRIRYVAGMRVYHPARTSFADLCRKWDRHTAHDFAKAAGISGRVKFLIKTAAMPLSPFIELPRIATSDRLEGVSSKVLAFRGLLRIRLYRFWIMLRLLAGRDRDKASEWNRGPLDS